MNSNGAIDQSDKPPIADCHRQVQRILQSASFRNATTLLQLFQFLTTRLLEGSSEPLKEYTIGVEAFGRSADFDPKTDTIVRVQIHRLRQKLGEYYLGEGRLDPMLVAIPKGHYLPTFESVADIKALDDRQHLMEQKFGESIKEDALGIDPDEAKRGSARGAAVWVATMAGVGVAFAIGMFVGVHRAEQANTKASGVSIQTLATAADPVKAFWAALLGNDSTPIIAHSDAVFLLDAHNDLFFFPSGANDYRGAPVDPHVAQQFAANPKLVAEAGKLYYENGYTGSGDMDAVGMVSNLLGQMGIKPVIEPGRDLTPGDLKQHSAILIGSSFQSYAVGQFNSVGDFTFVNPNPRLGGWAGTIVNSHPGPGEQSVYRTARDPATGVLTTDYALITIQPGVMPGRYVADLGGIDTTGCAGAAAFATSKTGVEELTKALATQGIHGDNGTPPLFQALLSVRLQKGNEVLGVTLLAVHPLFRGQKTSPSLN